jgi:hypothetical protein
MKQKLFIFSLLFTVFACTNKKQQDETDNLIYKEYYGNWVGSFMAEEYKGDDFVESNKINIRIISISNKNEVTGQSIVAGNKRPLTGTFDTTTKKFILKEPGNDKYDGTFEFTVSSNEIQGYWQSFNTNIPVTKRSYKLTKKDFAYNKNLMLPEEQEYYDYYNSVKKKIKNEEDSTTYYQNYYRFASDIILQLNASTTELKEDELKNLKKLELEIIRNTIYARHGFTFNKKSVRQFFDPVDWYVPISDDVEKSLTTVEIKNIVLLKRFEKYAEDNYDHFGR